MVVGIIGTKKGDLDKLRSVLLRAKSKGCTEFVFCDNRGFEQDGLKLASQLGLPITLITYPIPLDHPLANFVFYAPDEFICDYVDYLVCFGIDKRTEYLCSYVSSLIITEKGEEWQML